MHGYGSSIFSNPRPSQQRVNSSSYEHQIPTKRGEIRFNDELKCIEWQCDICYSSFTDARRWRDHHNKSGPHKNQPGEGRGLISYQKRRAANPAERTQTKRLRAILKRNIANETIELQRAVDYADKNGIDLLHL